MFGFKSIVSLIIGIAFFATAILSWLFLTFTLITFTFGYERVGEFFYNYGSFIGSIVAVLGVFYTVKKQIENAKYQIDYKQKQASKEGIKSDLREIERLLLLVRHRTIMAVTRSLTARDIGELFFLTQVDCDQASSMLRRYDDKVVGVQLPVHNNAMLSLYYLLDYSIDHNHSEYERKIESIIVFLSFVYPDTSKFEEKLKMLHSGCTFSDMGSKAKDLFIDANNALLRSIKKIEKEIA